MYLRVGVVTHTFELGHQGLHNYSGELADSRRCHRRGGSVVFSTSG